MRVAVISDVHGNAHALKAVQADIARLGVDLTLNLGDAVSGPLEPLRAADMQIEAGYPTLAGNHDRWIIERAPEAMDRVDRHVAAQLTPAHLDWLRRLPPTLVLDDIYLCHGTPTSDTDPWLDGWSTNRNSTLPDETAVTAKAEGLDFPLILCGHTHLSRIVRLRDGRLIVNPGSVGLQINHGAPDARYALVERRAGRWSASLHAVGYDKEAAAAQAVAQGFLPWREALLTGWAGPEGLF